MRIRIAANQRTCQAALTLTFLVGASFAWPALAQQESGRLKPVPTQTAQTAWRTAPARATPTHYKIDVAFEPDRHFLRATAAVTLRLDQPAHAIEFELNRRLALRSVRSGRASCRERV